MSRNPPNTKRLDAYSIADIEKHLPAYNDCKRVFKDWDFLVRIHMLSRCVHCPHTCIQIDHGVASMLCDVMQFEDPSKNPYQKVLSTRKVGYQEGDQISYTQTRRYMTSFAWLKEFLNDPKSIDVSMQYNVFPQRFEPTGFFLQPPPEDHKCLLVDCGHFGYEKIVRIGDEPHEYACILGVTGTLEPIMKEVDGKLSEQRKILERFCFREASANTPPKSLQCTFVPSVYSLCKGRLTFLERKKPSVMFVKSPEDFYLTIFKEIDDCNQDSKKDLKTSRAVLVVFETTKQLEDCANSPHLAAYKGVIQKLTPEMDDVTLKKNIIEQASSPGKITFMTREFGRGTDFKGTHKDMNECGGVRHLILILFGFVDLLQRPCRFMLFKRFSAKSSLKKNKFKVELLARVKMDPTVWFYYARVLKNIFATSYIRTTPLKQKKMRLTNILLVIPALRAIWKIYILLMHSMF